MDFRSIKRAALEELSELADDLINGEVECREVMGPGELGDSVRRERALREIADELMRRATGERKPVIMPIDPAQLSLLETP